MAKPLFRDAVGCCICRTKSSSSRFTSSAPYESTFLACFEAARAGVMCNPCVLITKRFRDNKEHLKGTRTWACKVDSKSGPGSRARANLKCVSNIDQRTCSNKEPGAKREIVSWNREFFHQGTPDDDLRAALLRSYRRISVKDSIEVYQGKGIWRNHFLTVDFLKPVGFVEVRPCASKAAFVNLASRHLQAESILRLDSVQLVDPTNSLTARSVTLADIDRARARYRVELKALRRSAAKAATSGTATLSSSTAGQTGVTRSASGVARNVKKVFQLSVPVTRSLARAAAIRVSHRSSRFVLPASRSLEFVDPSMRSIVFARKPVDHTATLLSEVCATLSGLGSPMGAGLGKGASLGPQGVMHFEIGQKEGVAGCRGGAGSESSGIESKATSVSGDSADCSPMSVESRAASECGEF